MNKFWQVSVINRKDILKMRQKQQFQFNYLQKKSLCIPKETISILLLFLQLS